MLDVMFYEVFKEEEKAIRELLPQKIQASFTYQTIQEKNISKAPAPFICIRTQSRIPPAWTNQIKGVLTRSRGYDHLINLSTGKGRKISCGYLEEYCSRAVAEQAVLMMMTLLRKLKTQIKNFDCFERNHLTGFECKDRRVLVVGVGSIGSEVADIAQGLRMQVRGVDIVRREKRFEYVSLSEGVKWADVVFCALPLTLKTKNLLNGSVFKKANPGFIFINIARGEIAPIRDLKHLLHEKKLGGLGLDVYPDEDQVANYLRGGRGKLSADGKIIFQLKDKENVLFTPHNAFNTQEALARKASLTAEAVKIFLKTGQFPLECFPN